MWRALRCASSSAAMSSSRPALPVSCRSGTNISTHLLSSQSSSKSACEVISGMSMATWPPWRSNSARDHETIASAERACWYSMTLWSPLLSTPGGKNLMVGKPWMPKRCDRRSLAVASTSATITPVPSSCCAACAYSGARARQCPHQGAMNATMKASSACSTVLSKLASSSWSGLPRVLNLFLGLLFSLFCCVLGLAFDPAPGSAPPPRRSNTTAAT
mmetsp:Transcript_1348/g.3987  ORF Transcript_1348/g.3987 Transcript_1348/m.3987 type:complete len:217 (+) Transcript_1348:436-1086(+)